MSIHLKYFDTHGHINFPDYTDREEAITRAQEAGVGMITVGTDLKSSREAVELAEKHEGMWAVVGLHPTDSTEEFDVEAFKKLAVHPKVVAIGECGLDYFHARPEEIPRQRDIFKQQIRLANEVKKLLMLHVRNGKKGESAYKEAASILEEMKSTVPFNSHFFAGTVEDMQRFIAMGGSVSFTGVLSFTTDYDEVVRQTPLDRIMSETDCPFVAPVPYRGKRNEPAYVIEVVKAIARIRGEDEAVVTARLLENVKKFFNI